MQHVMTWIKHEATYGRIGHWQYRHADQEDMHLRYLRAQVDNSLYFGIDPGRIIICTNFPFQYRGITNYIVKGINKQSAWLNKIVALHEIVENGVATDDIWQHDLDAWQLIPFDLPDGGWDVAVPIFYGPGRPHGASVFYKRSGFDILEEVHKSVIAGGSTNEEVHMKHVFLRHKIRDDKNPNGRWRILDRSWCAHIGQVDKIIGPVKVVHYHPESGIYSGYLEEKNKWRLVDDRLATLFKQYNLIGKRTDGIPDEHEIFNEQE